MTDKEKLMALLASFGIADTSYDDNTISFNGKSELNIGDHWVDVDFVFTEDGKFKELNLHGG